MDFQELLIISILIPGAIYIFNKFLLGKILSNKEKVIIIKNYECKNKEEELVVSFDSNESEINEKIRDFLEFENSIHKLLKEKLSDYSDIEIRHGKSVDFIIEYNDRKLAIECKSSLNHLNNKQINRYFNDEDFIDNLIVVGKGDIKDDLKKSFTNKYNEFGKKIEIIDKFNNEIEINFINEIKKILV